jgi:glycosyltransferase 2 family protein
VRQVGTVSVRGWRWARAIGGVAILALLVWQVGAGPFLHGVRAVDGGALAAAVGIGAVATICCAWRWRLVAARLGVRMPFGAAVGAYYRSQFLNMTLPGGVVGDVHRAVRHGLDIGDVRLGVRVVVLERLSGAVVQIILGVAMLIALPSPVRAYMPAAAAVLVAGVLTVALLARLLAWGGPRRWVRASRAAWSSIRDGVLVRRTWVGVVISTGVVLAGHVATFIIAARTAGSTLSWTRLVPLVLLALLAMGMPLNVAGWGPREGVAAWAFAAAGLTATQGVAVSVTYGVLAFASSLPGAAVLLAGWLRRRPAVPAPVAPPVAVAEPPVPVLVGGDAHG